MMMFSIPQGTINFETIGGLEADQEMMENARQGMLRCGWPDVGFVGSARTIPVLNPE
jgi:hypothetical protein